MNLYSARYWCTFIPSLTIKKVRQRNTACFNFFPRTQPKALRSFESMILTLC